MNQDVILDLPTELSSIKFAEQMARYLSTPLIMTFSGEIGAGKTTLIRAMLRCMGVNSAIKSPTFSLVESYQCLDVQIHHFDLYRIHDEAELDYIGFRDYFTADAVCCIEWPERLVSYLERADIAFSLRLKGAGRELHMRAFSVAGVELLSCLAGAS